MIKIIHNGEMIAMVLKKEDQAKEGLSFFTESENSFQLGIINQKAGHIIEAHIHNKIPKTINDRQEMLYLEKGKMKVTLFEENGDYIYEEILNAGDLILLIDKGHGFEFLEESKVIYVKQGPYIDKDADKQVFQGKNDTSFHS